jgi:hypothetical protein
MYFIFIYIYLPSNLLFIRCVNLLPPPDDVLFLRTAHVIYVQYQKFIEALSLAVWEIQSSFGETLMLLPTCKFH